MKRTNQLTNWTGCAAVAAGIMLTSVSQAALYFWDNDSADGLFSTAANWNPNGNPGSADLTVANVSSLAPITVNGNWDVDSLRMSDGGSVAHNSGTLTITDGVGPDDGLWVAEGGNAACTYTLNGGSIVLNDNANSFDIGRGNGAVGYFNMNGGTVTNLGTGDAFFLGRFGGSFGRVNLAGGVLNGPPAADTHIGLDGAAEWFQSGGTYNSGAVQIGRFASPFATVELSGSAAWNVGLVLMADGHGVFNPRNSGPVDLKVIGSNVVFNATGFVAMKEANITFDGTGGGLSTLRLGNGIMLLDDAEIFFANLPTPSATNQTIILFDNIGSYPGPDAQFINGVDGTIYDAGLIDWQIKYQGTNIVLVSVPDCVAPNISIQPVSQQVVLSNSVTFSVGAGGTELLYQWQTNGVDIAGANGSSYTIPVVLYSDELTYRVIVSNVCSGIAVTSSNAVLDVVAPHTFYTWDNGGGDNLFSNTNNWNPDGLPFVQDFAGDFVTNLLVINGDWSVDTFRTGAGATVLHTNGTLTIVNGVFSDNGLFAGEFGTNCSYTLAGGTIRILDPVDGFMVGRNGDSVSAFNFISGNITNTVGDTHIGLDGVATWTQSGGVFRGAGVQIGRFANPAPVLAELSGNALWNVGLVLLADGHGAFNPRNSNAVNLTLVGPNVSYDSTGLVMFDEGNLTFDGTGGGVSTMNLGNGIFLLTNGKLYATNLPNPTVLGQEMVLLENIGSYPGADQQFDNAPDGTVYNVPCGGQWTLDYRPNVNPTNVVLVATVVPAAVNITSIVVGSGNATISFTAGATDTAGCFELWGSASVTGPYSNLGAVITSPGAGNFQTTVSLSGATGFYRIRRL